MSVKKSAIQLANIRRDADEKRRLKEVKLRQEAIKRQTEADLQASLAKRTGTTQDLIKKAVARVPQAYSGTEQINHLLGMIAKKAPRLLQGDYIEALEGLSLYGSSFVRKPSDWKPVGKGRDSLFRSLCEHLLMQYRMPPFLWSCFFHSGRTRSILSSVAVSLAGGESLNKLVKQKTLPVPLTKAMAHSFLAETTSGMGMMEGLRRTQIKALGGDSRLLRAWMKTNQGREILTAEQEAFWTTVLQWFAANPMLDTNQIGPMVDYIQFRRNEDISFSMKGRAPLALMRSMQEWHANLQANRATGGGSLYDLRAVYSPSGFKAGVFDMSYRPNPPHGALVENKWFVDEILSAKALSEEGKKMHHCVLSYSPYISRGDTSIWTVVHQTTFQAEKVLTLEVRNANRSIVQIRGVCNRQALPSEMDIVQKWAALNSMAVTSRW